MNTLIIMLPLLGTVLGTLSVFFIKKNNDKTKQLTLGFSSGVMLVVTFLSLIIPALDLVKDTTNTWFPIIFGILLGVFIILSLDLIINKKRTNNALIIVIAIILHNIPEGFATGVSLAGSVTNNISINDALLLSLAITLHNIPEGIIVALNSKNNKDAIKFGILSGIVEPVSALLTFLITKEIINLMPYMLTFAGGAMLYVICDELIPESKNKNNKLGVIGVSIGIIIMLLLELIFG